MEFLHPQPQRAITPPPNMYDKKFLFNINQFKKQNQLPLQDCVIGDYDETKNIFKDLIEYKHPEMILIHWINLLAYYGCAEIIQELIMKDAPFDVRLCYISLFTDNVDCLKVYFAMAGHDENFIRFLINTNFYDPNGNCIIYLSNLYKDTYSK